MGHCLIIVMSIIDFSTELLISLISIHIDNSGNPLIGIMQNPPVQYVVKLLQNVYLQRTGQWGNRKVGYVLNHPCYNKCTKNARSNSGLYRIVLLQTGSIIMLLQPQGLFFCLQCIIYVNTFRHKEHPVIPILRIGISVNGNKVLFY